MNGVLRAVVLLVSVLLVVGVPAEAVKPKAKACKKGMVKVKAGKTTRCVKVRVAPPKPKAVDHGKVAFDRVLAASWPALKDRRGRKVRSPLQELRRVPGGLAKVRAVIPKGLKLAAAKRPGAAAAPRSAHARSALAPRSARAHAHAAQGGGSLAGVAEGSDVGFDAVIPAGEYRIEISYRTDDIDGGIVRGVRCPTAAGVLKGDLDVRTRLTMRITRDGELVSASTTRIGEEAHFEGSVADDAKVDTLDIDHTSTLNHSAEGGGHAAIAIRMRARRTAQVDMRSPSSDYTLKSKTLDLRADVAGAPPDQVADLDAEASRKLLEGSDKSFARVVAKGTENFRKVESEVNQPGTCAILLFDPTGEGARPTPKGGTGTFTSTVRPRADPGNDAPGRWTLTDRRRVSITPEFTTGIKPSFTFTVTDDSAPSGSAQFRATSKAGVAVGTRPIPIEEAAPRYRVTAFTWTDQLALDGLPPLFPGCGLSTSQTNTITLLPSPEGALGPPLPAPLGHGEQTGTISVMGRLLKTAAFSGCKPNDDATAYVPCHVQSAGSEDTFIAIDLLVDGPGPATLTWHLRPVGIGDVPPVPSSGCAVAATQGTGPLTAVTTVPRETLFEPGAHTLTLDLPYEEAAGGGTLHSHASYAVTIERL